MINVLVVEDNDAIREGLKILIDGTNGYCCIAAFPRCDLMLKTLEKINPEYPLMDEEKLKNLEIYKEQLDKE